MDYKDRIEVKAGAKAVAVSLLLHEKWSGDYEVYLMDDGSVWTTNHNIPCKMTEQEIREHIGKATSMVNGLENAIEWLRKHDALR